MASITTSSRPADNTQQGTTKPAGAPLGQSGSMDPFAALGLSGDQSRAGTWAQAAFDALKANGTENVYRVGTITGANASVATVGYVAFEYKQTPVFCLVVFETSHDSIMRGIENGRPYYLTVDDMINKEFITSAATTIKADQNYMVSPYFIQLHVVQQSVPLSQEKCLSITSHLLASIMARGDNDGKFDFQNAAGLDYSFTTNDEGATVDRNGQVHRADWTMEVSARPAKTATYVKPTLTEGVGSGSVAPVGIVGFVNMRYTGSEKPLNASENPAAWDPAQVSAEMTVTSIDAVSAGYKHMLERSLLALSGVADIARQGGWVAPLLVSLKEKNRKLSSLADHLLWATKMDTQSFDANQESKVEALKLMCHKTAAVNVIHRNGDSLGGLSALLSEVALGNENSLAQLLIKLDTMFHSDNLKPFSARLAAELGIGTLQSDSIVATAVPVMSGTYSSTNGPRSIEDVDLVYITNRFNDNFEEVQKYVLASSYDHRNLDPEQIRLYLMDTTQQLLGGSSVKFSGNALNMVMNPTFMEMLVNDTRRMAEVQLRGVEAHSMVQASLFQGGRTYNVSGAGGPGVNSSFGNSNYGSQFKF